MCVRVKVDLRHFYNDERSRCFVSLPVNREELKVSWLAGRLRELLGKVFDRPLAFSTEGHLLPSEEPLTIIRSFDTVVVIPLDKEWEVEKSVSIKNSGLCQNEQQEIRNKPIKKKKKKHHAVESVESDAIIENLPTEQIVPNNGISYPNTNNNKKRSPFSNDTAKNKVNHGAKHPTKIIFTNDECDSAQALEKDVGSQIYRSNKIIFRSDDDFTENINEDEHSNYKIFYTDDTQNGKGQAIEKDQLSQKKITITNCDESKLSENTLSYKNFEYQSKKINNPPRQATSNVATNKKNPSLPSDVVDGTDVLQQVKVKALALLDTVNIAPIEEVVAVKRKRRRVRRRKPKNDICSSEYSFAGTESDTHMDVEPRSILESAEPDQLRQSVMVSSINSTLPIDPSPSINNHILSTDDLNPLNSPSPLLNNAMSAPNDPIPPPNDPTSLINDQIQLLCPTTSMMASIPTPDNLKQNKEVPPVVRNVAIVRTPRIVRALSSSPDVAQNNNVVESAKPVMSVNS